jgi:hypothetical protein
LNHLGERDVRQEREPERYRKYGFHFTFDRELPSLLNDN